MDSKIATSVDAYHNVGASPYAEEPFDVTANPEIWGDPYASQIKLMRDMVTLLTRLANASDSQRVTPRQTNIFLSSVAQTTQINLKTEWLILAATAAATLSLVVGSSTLFTFPFAGADTKVIPFFVNIGPGVDLTVTASAGTGTGFIIAYPAG